MIPEITDKNLYLLLPGKVAAVVEQYVDDYSVSVLEGLCKFYNSSTYRKLEKEQTMASRACRFVSGIPRELLIL